jgi:hypothetical protein
MASATEGKIDVEVTHAFCIDRAVKTLKSVYKAGLSAEIIEHTLATVDRWLKIAAEIRAGDELASYKFNALKRQLEEESM